MVIKQAMRGIAEKSDAASQKILETNDDLFKS